MFNRIYTMKIDYFHKDLRDFDKRSRTADRHPVVPRKGIIRLGHTQQRDYLCKYTEIFMIRPYRRAVL